MIVSDAAGISDPLRVPPKAQKHSRRMNAFAKGMEALGKPLAIHRPIADHGPPKAVRRCVPAGVNKEDLSAQLHGLLDGMIHLFRCDFKFGSNTGLNQPTSTPVLGKEDAAPQMGLHRLDCSVQISKYQAKVH